MSIDGIIVVSKPAGITSHDVILKLRKWLKTKKIGHTGTLDPQVVGVLPLCIGRGTKLVEYLQEMPKTYIAEVTFGIATDTEDQTGEITAEERNHQLDDRKVEKAILSFIGKYQQTPPMYSAVKIAGKKLYELAREGKVIDRPARTVEIYAIEIIAIDLEREFPVARFRVRCSKGTYIRTLCVDIGKRLQLPAHMSSLIRIESAGYKIEQAHTLEEIEQAVYDHQVEKLILPIDQALSCFPELVVPDYLVAKILNGRPILPRFPLPEDLRKGERIRILSPEGKLLAIHTVLKEKGIWSKPDKILSKHE